MNRIEKQTTKMHCLFLFFFFFMCIFVKNRKTISHNQYTTYTGIDTYRMLKLFRRHANYNNGQLVKLRPESEKDTNSAAYVDNYNDYGQGIDRIDYQGDYEHDY